MCFNSWSCQKILLFFFIIISAFCFQDRPSSAELFGRPRSGERPRSAGREASIPEEDTQVPEWLKAVIMNVSLNVVLFLTGVLITLQSRMVWLIFQELDDDFIPMPGSGQPVTPVFPHLTPAINPLPTPTSPGMNLVVPGITPSQMPCAISPGSKENALLRKVKTHYLG